MDSAVQIKNIRQCCLLAACLKYSPPWKPSCTQTTVNECECLNVEILNKCPFLLVAAIDPGRPSLLEAVCVKSPVLTCILFRLRSWRFLKNDDAFCRLFGRYLWFASVDCFCGRSSLCLPVSYLATPGVEMLRENNSGWNHTGQDYLSWNGHFKCRIWWL